MSKLTAIIVDDEPGARATLRTMLEKYCEQVEIIGESDNVSDAFALISSRTPDVLFLDIQIKNEQGFDLLEKFKSRDFEVIFTTAYSQYGVQAIKEEATDYLVKPIDIEELITAVNKVSQRSTKDESTGSKLVLPTNNGYEVIEKNTIVYCEADNNYTNIVLSEGKSVIASKTLKNIESQLSTNQFFRTHRSFVVNLNEVQQVSKGKGGTITLSNGDEVYISRDRKEELIMKLAEL